MLVCGFERAILAKQGGTAGVLSFCPSDELGQGLFLFLFPSGVFIGQTIMID
jgi:hypothetical protein